MRIRSAPGTPPIEWPKMPTGIRDDAWGTRRGNASRTEIGDPRLERGRGVKIVEDRRSVGCLDNTRVVRMIDRDDGVATRRKVDDEARERGCRETMAGRGEDHTADMRSRTGIGAGVGVDVECSGR
jgi:hypothetical protein